MPQLAPPIKRSPPWQSNYPKKDSSLIIDMIGIRRLEADGNIPVARRRRLYRSGEIVRVINGPFASFAGTIERLDSHGRLKVLLSIFSRMTSVELDEGQIEAA